MIEPVPEADNGEAADSHTSANPLPKSSDYSKICRLVFSHHHRCYGECCSAVSTHCESMNIFEMKRKRCTLKISCRKADCRFEALPTRGLEGYGPWLALQICDLKDSLISALIASNSPSRKCTRHCGRCLSHLDAWSLRNLDLRHLPSSNC